MDAIKFKRKQIHLFILMFSLSSLSLMLKLPDVNALRKENQSLKVQVEL